MLKKWKQKRAAERRRQELIARDELLTKLKNTAGSLCGVSIQNAADPHLDIYGVKNALWRLITLEMDEGNPNMKLAHQLLFTDPGTGEELFVRRAATDNDDGGYSFTVTNKDGSVTWKHTIKTEEV